MLISDLFEMPMADFVTIKQLAQSNFRRSGIDIIFPKHSGDRSTEAGRGDDVSQTALLEVLDKLLKLIRSGNPSVLKLINDAKRGYSNQAVIKHTVESDINHNIINVPCVFEPGRGGNLISLVIKTIMVKSDFHTKSSDIVIVV